MTVMKVKIAAIHSDLSSGGHLDEGAGAVFAQGLFQILDRCDLRVPQALLNQPWHVLEAGEEVRPSTRQGAAAPAAMCNVGAAVAAIIASEDASTGSAMWPGFRVCERQTPDESAARDRAHW